jgi:hypothetical protein
MEALPMINENGARRRRSAQESNAQGPADLNWGTRTGTTHSVRSAAMGKPKRDVADGTAEGLLVIVLEERHVVVGQAHCNAKSEERRCNPAAVEGLLHRDHSLPKRILSYSTGPTSKSRGHKMELNEQCSP